MDDGRKAVIQGAPSFSPPEVRHKLPRINLLGDTDYGYMKGLMAANKGPRLC